MLPLTGVRAGVLCFPRQALLSHKLFQVNFLTTLSGQALVTMIYHRPLGDDWLAAAEALRAKLSVQGVVGRSHKQARGPKRRRARRPESSMS